MSTEGTLHPRIAAALAAGANVPPYHQLPLAQARAMARAGYLRAGDPVPVGSVRDLEAPGAQGPLRVRLYLPAGTTTPPPLVVFFHGSGFVLLDLDTHDDLCRRLCAASGCAVASVDYRLAPEHPFPAAPDDCLAATRWLAAQATALGVDGTRLVLCGDSAGGCLAVVTALRLREEGGPALRGQLLFYPVLDLTPAQPQGSYAHFHSGFGLGHERMAWFWAQYLGPQADAAPHPHAAPARTASVEGLPPAHVEVAEFDVLRDEGEAWAHRLQAAGIAAAVWRAPGMNHGYMKYAGELPAADASLQRACAWLGQVTAAGAGSLQPTDPLLRAQP